MLIELESPFKELWRKGYLVINKEPRRNVVLYNSQKDRTTIAYAKYLMSVHLGRVLSKDEIVDHINGDKLDDRLDNYQILTNRDNLVKGLIQNNKSRQYVRYRCACGKVFEKDRRHSNLIPSNRNKQCYCCRKCAGKFGGKIPSSFIEEFRVNLGLNSQTKLV